MNPLIVLANEDKSNRSAKDRQHECFSCTAFYDKLQAESRIKEFPCRCKLSSDIQLGELRKLTSDLSEEEQMYLEYSVDPVAWADFEADWKARWYQEEILRCLKWDQKVFMADGTIKNISDVRVGDSVISYNEVRREFPKSYKVTAVYDNGVRDVVRIRLDNGDSIEVTPNHPILTHFKAGAENLLHGCKSYKVSYKSLDEGLSVGDRVYTMNRFGAYGDVEDENLAKILGYVASDGYVSGGPSKFVQFANTNKNYVDEFVRCVKTRFPKSRITVTHKPGYADAGGVNHRDSWIVAVRRSDRGNRWREVEEKPEEHLVDFLRSIGAAGPETRESAIFNYAFRLSLGALRLFLNRCWAGDGCIYNKQDKKLGRTVSSLTLAGGDPETLRIVRLLLKKIGVWASHIYLDNDGNKGCVISIGRSSDIRQFFEEIGPIYGKERASTIAMAQVAATLNSGSNIRKRRRFSRHARTRVVSIEKIGAHRVFDITVDTRHNFVSNGVVVHNCSSRYKVVRAGRRSGKTEALSIDICHKTGTTDNFRALVIAPYQDQVDLIFEKLDKFIERSMTLQHMVTRRSKHPSQRIEFSNGSVIMGVTAGVKTGARANKVRGQDAHGIWLDEVDMLAQEDLESVLAILSSHKECYLWASGTPTGKREHLYRWCTDKGLVPGFREFHYPASVSPEWTLEVEGWFRATYSSQAYAQEFDADFGEEAQGVFAKKLIDEAIVSYDMDTRQPYKEAVYGLGVDWNDTTHGVHMVVVGWHPADGRFWLERKAIISNLEFTQTKAMEKIIELNAVWNPSFIYVDQGFGNTQIELLRSYGIKNPATRIAKKLKGIQMGGKIDVKDPIYGMVKKDTKPFIVGLSVRRMEQAEVILPRSEYKGEGAATLVDQMTKFRIKRFSPEGRPVYDQTPDHTLTAWMLAIFGFWMEHTDLSGRRSIVTSVGMVGGSAPKKESNELPAGMGWITFKVDGEREKEKAQEKSRNLMPVPRNVQPMRTNGNLSDIAAHQEERKRVGGQIKKAGQMGFYSYMAKPHRPRKTF